MGQIEWKYVLNNIDDNSIALVEKKLGIVFPESYKSTVKKYNLGRPQPNIFDSVIRKELVAKQLLSLNSADKGNLLETYSWLHSRLPQGVVPFMSDPFGNYICFNFAKNKEPQIVFWDHEAEPIKSISPVANDFQEFIDKLYEV